jgi:uncharacterized protein (DUF433 family)
MKLPTFLCSDEYGEIRLTGHRIGLYTIVRLHKEGLSDQDIVDQFDTLPLELIERVLDFYRANRNDVDTYVEEVRAEITRQEAIPPGPGVVKVRELLSQRAKVHE